jgi:ABC-2 type transport system ATP-binding protein
MTDKILLEVQNLVKQYPKLTAVNDTSFKVKEGTCFGLLGPNGAGKSTTIECIEMVSKPTSGKILFKGSPTNRNFLVSLGVQFQETALPPKLTVKECLEFFSNLYEKSVPIEELIEKCQLGEYLNQQHDKISGGQRQRLLLAVALCHDPELVMLDEPTTGLDPQSRRNLWDLVKSIKAKGKTIILTTHYMDEAYELCDEIAIMDHGKIIALGSPQELLRENFKTVVIVIPKSGNENFLEAVKVLGEIEIQEQQNHFEVRTESLNETLSQLSELKLDLSGMSIRQSNLEDLFIKLTGKELRG